jgi:hypothetical protein
MKKVKLFDKKRPKAEQAGHIVTAEGADRQAPRSKRLKWSKGHPGRGSGRVGRGKPKTPTSRNQSAYEVPVMQRITVPGGTEGEKPLGNGKA